MAPYLCLGLTSALLRRFMIPRDCQVGEIIQRRAEDSNIPIGGTARAGKMVLEKLGGKGTRAAAPVLMKSPSSLNQYLAKYGTGGNDGHAC